MLDEFIIKIQPEICFVVGWYFLINQKIINMVPGGFLGVHNSCLPKYRGFAPLVWSMINGEKVCGFSLFSFSEKMDEGRIWVQKEIDITDSDYIEDVLIKIQKEVEKAFEQHYLDILDERMKPHDQKNIEPSYGGKRLPSDGQIDWNWPAKRVYNFIRAQSAPYPGAYTIFEGDKLIIWRAHLNETEFYGTPGQVGLINTDGVSIVCGDNRVIVLDLVGFREKTGAANKIIKSLNYRFGRE